MLVKDLLLQVCLESKEQESKEKEKRNNIYSSKVDYVMGDGLFDILNRM